MGFFDKLFGGKAKDENTSKFTNQSKTILTPLQGKVLAQADIPDETFAQGILGPGCGIEPTGAAGHPTATAIIVTDGADDVKMLAEGDVVPGTPLFKV